MTAQLDLAAIRARFPALALEVAGRPAAFLDGPAGTQVPRSVVDAISNHLIHANANTAGAFVTSVRNDEAIAAARAALADLLGCEAREIAFGANMTTLTFALARALAREWKPGDEVVVTAIDHDANVAPWKALEDAGIVVRTANFRVEDCTLDLEDLERKVGPRTKLVAVGWASNAAGTIHPIRKAGDIARRHGALFFVDAVHYAPHAFIDVAAIGCDFLACSVYKFYGPHVGVLFGRAELLEKHRPYKVRPAPDTLPDRWETGTQNHECLAGVSAAVDYLASLGGPANDGRPRRERLRDAFERIGTHERALAHRFLDGLHSIKGIHLYGIADPARLHERAPTFSMRLSTMSPADASAALAAQGIFTWSGNYYAIGFTERIGVEQSGGLLRIGFVHYNTIEEVDRTLSALSELTSHNR